MHRQIADLVDLDIPDDSKIGLVDAMLAEPMKIELEEVEKLFWITLISLAVC